MKVNKMKEEEYMKNKLLLLFLVVSCPCFSMKKKNITKKKEAWEKEAEIYQLDYYKKELIGIIESLKNAKEYLHTEGEPIDFRLARREDRWIVPIILVSTDNQTKYIACSIRNDIKKFLDKNPDFMTIRVRHLFGREFPQYILSNINGDIDPELSAFYLNIVHLTNKNQKQLKNQKRLIDYLKKVYVDTSNRNVKVLASCIYFNQFFAVQSITIKKINKLLDEFKKAFDSVNKELKIDQIKEHFNSIIKATVINIEETIDSALAFLDSLELTKEPEKHKKPVKEKPQKKKTITSSSNAASTTSAPQKFPEEETPSAQEIISSSTKSSTSMHQTQEVPPQRQVELKYDQRIEDWFNPSFIRNKKYSSILYHTFPKIIDQYIINLGLHEKRSHRTRNQLDDYYCIFGQIKFDNGKGYFVQYHLTIDPQGLIYHRGFNKLTYDEAMQEESSDILRVLQEENLDESEPQQILTNMQDGIIEETDLIVKIRDNKLRATFIVYKQVH